jgi:hypothetical protein
MNKQPMMSLTMVQKKPARANTSNILNKLNQHQAAAIDNEYFMKGAVRAKRLVDLPKADTVKHADAHRILERITAMKTTQNTVMTD